MGALLMQEVEAYAETTSCRRQFLLAYFGEDFNVKECSEMCDNCKHPKEKVEVQKELRQVLEAVLQLNENYTLKTLVDFVTGQETKEMKDFKFNKLTLFGIGKDKDDTFWSSVFRQAILHKFLRKDIETYGVLKVTELGYQFIDKPYSFKIPINHNYDEMDTDEEEGTGKTAVLDDTLLKLLKDLRRAEAKKKNVPPFVIFQDPSLEDMATQYPI